MRVQKFFRFNAFSHVVTFLYCTQRYVHTEYLKKHINSAQYYCDSDKSELINFLDERPNHPSVMKKFNSLGNDIERPCIERLNVESMNAYFLAGAEGNDAIMPPSTTTERSLIYNPFYSKNSLQHFRKRLEEIISNNILCCHPDRFEMIYSNLSLFRQKYYQISLEYQKSYNEVLNIFSYSRFQLEAPLVAI